MTTLNIMVLGECGDGKSQLIKHYTDKAGIEGPVPGMDAKGKTKDIKKYNVGNIRGRAVTLIDTPGVGDMDVKVGQLVAMIEAFLENDKVNGIILCSGVHQNRITLGARVMAMLADKGFQGARKWDAFILVGTHKDRCKQTEIDAFISEHLPDLNKECHGTINKVAFTALDPDQSADVAQLEDMIQKLPNAELAYQAPDPKVLAEEYSKIMGVEIQAEVIEKEIIVYRDALKEVLKGLATGLTLGGIQWEGDTPVLAAWVVEKGKVVVEKMAGHIIEKITGSSQ